MGGCERTIADSPAVAERKHGLPPPPTTSTFDATSWGDRSFSGSRHVAVLFVGTDLSDVVEQRATFTDCTFRGVLFSGSSHVDAAFTNCTFTDCTFFDTRFTRCKLVGSMFDRCAFRLLMVDEGDWSFVGLPGADLRHATFDRTRMREADLTGARFDGATIRDVDLSGAWLHRASFEKADLRGSDLSSLDPLNVDLAGARIDATQATVIAEALGLIVEGETA
jgi:uncharacterized protein YjbI with pentapeptide repeats